MNKPQNKILKWTLIVLSVILALILVLVLTFVILSQIGKAKLLNTSDTEIVLPVSSHDVENDGKTVVYKGKKYQYNENLTSVLVMGIDKEDIPDESSEVYGANGQADMLLLIVLDTATGEMKALPISRDTMLDVEIYSESGQYLGISKKQLCLSYAYGDGKEKSCENTVKSVSRLIYGMPINSYVAFDINSIKKLNDTIGGVSITATNDITLYDKTIKKGQTVNLKGEYALKFIRERDKVNIDSNNERMDRQKQYMSSFFKKVMTQTRKEISTPVKLYNSVSDDVVSNIDISKVAYLTQCVLLDSDNTTLNYISLKGNVVMGEKYAEFYHDEQALFDLVINTFYKPVTE